MMVAIELKNRIASLMLLRLLINWNGMVTMSNCLEEECPPLNYKRYDDHIQILSI